MKRFGVSTVNCSWITGISGLKLHSVLGLSEAVHASHQSYSAIRTWVLDHCVDSYACRSSRRDLRGIIEIYSFLERHFMLRPGGASLSRVHT